MKGKTGTFLTIPYDFTRPTWGKIARRAWNPDTRRIWVPHAFGWGYTVNLYEVFRRLGIVGRRR